MDTSSVEAASCDALPSVFEVISSFHMPKNEKLAHFQEEVRLHNQQRHLSVIVLLMFDYISDLLITLNYVHFLSLSLSHTHTHSLSLPPLSPPPSIQTTQQSNRPQLCFESVLVVLSSAQREASTS
jgi:hypothetical protein